MVMITRVTFLKKCPLLPLAFRKNTFPFPVLIHVFITLWKYKQQMVKYKNIYYYNTNEKIDPYKIKFLNSALKRYKHHFKCITV